MPSVMMWTPHALDLGLSLRCAHPAASFAYCLPSDSTFNLRGITRAFHQQRLEANDYCTTDISMEKSTGARPFPVNLRTGIISQRAKVRRRPFFLSHMPCMPLLSSR